MNGLVARLPLANTALSGNGRSNKIQSAPRPDDKTRKAETDPNPKAARDEDAALKGGGGQEDDASDFLLHTSRGDRMRGGQGEAAAAHITFHACCAVVVSEWVSLEAATQASLPQEHPTSARHGLEQAGGRWGVGIAACVTVRPTGRSA